MLKTKNITENLKIENGKAYAVFSLEETKRQLDGCETRKELAKQILDKRKEIEEINNLKNKAVGELAALMQADNKLVSIGCCDLSKPVYKSIDGIIQKDANGNPIIDHYTHDDYCKHKEG